MLEEIYDTNEIADIFLCVCSDEVLLGKANAVSKRKNKRQVQPISLVESNTSGINLSASSFISQFSTRGTWKHVLQIWVERLESYLLLACGAIQYAYIWPQGQFSLCSR